ncbi:endoglucanase [Cyclonatronum proteinivorum]|uniref:Endoglucanase n=1 Tax=Cyclonatronum proteinivorum TaxID=1457365 RepID=A0A345UIA3_9BACT|nr:M42 family metallopeptidase [Cyclonatronum proteinivorum]AXJ00205.1 endoglucanase [Cyclonatronum proteinivorum]
MPELSVDFALLKQICETPGAPGFEEPVRTVVEHALSGFADEISTDGMGNLIVRKKGGKRKVMAAAHLDEIALISTGVDKNGFIRFHTLGGFDAKSLLNQRVIVHGSRDLPGIIGGKAPHTQSDEEKKRTPKTTELFIDCGLNEEEVSKAVPVGTPITRDQSLKTIGNNISCKSLDNRISVYILLEAFRQAASTGVDLYAVFTVQEEVGLRGARVAAHAIQPEVGLALDVTLANDLPGADTHQKISVLGEGTAIKVMDGSVICTPKLVTFLETLALDHDIAHQRELLTAGGTDTAALQYLTGVGAQVGCVSTPTRYLHTTVESCNLADVLSGIKLTKAFIEQAHTYFAL